MTPSTNAEIIYWPADSESRIGTLAEWVSMPSWMCTPIIVMSFMYISPDKPPRCEYDEHDRDECEMLTKATFLWLG